MVHVLMCVGWQVGDECVPFPVSLNDSIPLTYLPCSLLFCVTQFMQCSDLAHVFVVMVCVQGWCEDGTSVWSFTFYPMHTHICACTHMHSMFRCVKSLSLSLCFVLHCMLCGCVRCPHVIR